MKKFLVIASFIIIFTMAFGTVRVFADTDVSTDPSVILDRRGPNTNAGDKSDMKATQQAAKDDRTEVRATEKVERMDAKLAGKKYHFRGEVTEVTATTLSVKLKSDEVMVFALTPTTCLQDPDPWPRRHLGRIECGCSGYRDRRKAR